MNWTHERLRKHIHSPLDVIVLEDAMRRASLMIEILRDRRVLVELSDDANVLDTAVWTQMLAFFGGTVYAADTKLPLQGALSATAPSTLSIRCSDRSVDLANQSIEAGYAQLDAIQTSKNS